MKYEKVDKDKVKLTFTNVYDGLSVIGQNGFELACEHANVKEGYKVKVGEKNNTIIIELPKEEESVGEIVKIAYSINPQVDESAYLDLKKQLCIFNSKGLPSDQFKIDLV